MLRMNCRVVLALTSLYFIGVNSDYWTERKLLISKENSFEIGANLRLSPEETIVNEMLMTAKNEELLQGFLHPERFPPARHFFESKPDIDKSKVFKFISKMPKGGALHVHDTSLSSLNYVLYNITYRHGLYMCITDDIQLKFFEKQPENNCWKLVKDLRENNSSFDLWLSSKLTLKTDNPLEKYPDVNSIWKAFQNIFNRVTPMLCYKPVFEDYFYNALQEFYEDNVNYIEVRSTLPELHELNGTIYNSVEVLGFLKKVADRFTSNYPNFLGIKFIYAPSRFVNNATMSVYLDNVKKMKELYPDFLIGFDLVGQEDNGQPLEHFIKQLINVPKNIKFYFHAGETTWNGMTTDLNLIDAILLNTTRIGHGYALLKHSLALQLIKKKHIAIEVNPISNQVLNLVKDLRNHPANFLIANDYPVVISSDDPGFFDSSGLTYDLYEAFMGMASKNADLKMLKQFAINSLIYSSMNSVEKRNAKIKFNKIWNGFITDVLYKHDYYSVVRGIQINK